MNSSHSEIILRGDNITQSYEGERIIENISVSLNRGEFVSIVGASGTGKTTLFNTLSGLEKPDEGTVTLNGVDVTGQSGKVSYMQQKDLLLPFKTVIDNVALPLRLRGIAKKEATLQARALLSEFGLEGCEKKYPVQLSGGMRQRAALLRSYLFNDQLMLLDEPFSALDAITKMSLHKWFRGVCATHETSAFLITHDIDEAITLSNRIYVIAGSPGRIVTELKIEHPDTTKEQEKKFFAYKREILSYI